MHTDEAGSLVKFIHWVIEVNEWNTFNYTQSINNHGFGATESTIRGRDQDAAAEKMQMTALENKVLQASQWVFFCRFLIINIILIRTGD